MQSLRSKAITIAHQIKTHFSDWGKSQSAAWIIAKLDYRLINAILFLTSKGEERKATIASLNLTTLSKGYVRFWETLTNGEMQPRSFRVERIDVSQTLSIA